MSARAALVAALVAVALASGCAASTTPEAEPQREQVQPERDQPAAQPAAVSEADARTSFLTTTAEHVCAAQSEVYDDPAALAEALSATPEYDDLADDQVAALQADLASDPRLGAALADAIAEVCG